MFKKLIFMITFAHNVLGAEFYNLHLDNALTFYNIRLSNIESKHFPDNRF